MSLRAASLAYLVSTLLVTPAFALETSQGSLTVTEVATGFDQPWGIGHLPDGGILVTERDGAVIHLRPDGTRVSLSGVPEVVADGQGGMLDVMIPRDFADSREVFLSYVAREGRTVGTALGVGRLNAEGTGFETFEKLWQMAPHPGQGRHFGSRIVEAHDGHIFLTTGDRGDRPSAQDISNHNGAVIRLTRSGAVPADNPLTGQAGAQPEIYSYGHRNPQGAALDLDGTLWVVEHGARGGDEINKVIPGANYGWPVISYGTHYSGAKIGEGTRKTGMQQPKFYWDPSMAPSGMMIYSGKLWPEWEGDMFVGSLKFSYISRLSGENVQEVEQIESRETSRVRDIVEGPDGAIWFLSVNNGSLYKITP
ncbi:MAG: PQQ-dependent sugar dehydrogenase [Pseudomonadota bacterium]